MRDLGGRETARSDLVLFAGCVIVALLALALPRPWAASLTATIRETALRPLVAMRSRAVSERTSRQGLEALEHNRDSLALLVQDFATVSHENTNLRGLLALPPPTVAPLLERRGNLSTNRRQLTIGWRCSGSVPPTECTSSTQS